MGEKKVVTKRARAIKNRRAGRRNEKALSERLGTELKGLYGGQDAFDEIFSDEYK